MATIINWVQTFSPFFCLEKLQKADCEGYTKWLTIFISPATLTVSTYISFGNYNLSSKHQVRLTMSKRILKPEGNFCGQVNQSVRYDFSYLQLIFLIPKSTNNPSHKSVILESSLNSFPNQAWAAEPLMGAIALEPINSRTWTFARAFYSTRKIQSSLHYLACIRGMGFLYACRNSELCILF